MTKYTITIVTYRTGMEQYFEFSTTSARDSFVQMFINGIAKHDRKEIDFVMTIQYGERTGMNVK